MKRFSRLLAILFAVFMLSGIATFAAEDGDVLNYDSMNMKNIWDRNGKYEEKILEVGTKLLNDNKIDKRIAFQMIRNYNTINAVTTYTDKTVHVYYGILPYIDNDDELAYLLGHEMTHALDGYGGPLKWVNMRLNSKDYETKADLNGIDLMVKAGYNPIASITFANKWMPEEYWDIFLLTTHPKTSVRLMNMYKYIYVKYPWALQSDMTKNVNYQNFLRSSAKEISEFKQHEAEHADAEHKEDL